MGKSGITVAEKQHPKNILVGPVKFMMLFRHANGYIWKRFENMSAIKRKSVLKTHVLQIMT